VGRVIGGRYELLRVIGEGGMGTVHEARHTTTHKRCAVKLVDKKITKMPGASERFLREARAPAAIDHPGIAEVLDGGTEDDGSLFLVMELLEGQSFEELLGDETRPLGQKLMLLEQMLEPLAAAHAKGFVHRDLKPDNVFVVEARDGRELVKLLDFGIARQMGASRLTETGVPMGTVYYMSPEQARSAREAEPTSDVWSFGVMLYEVLTGELPFDGETVADILVKICTEQPKPARELRPDAPAPLAQLAERCLAKDVNQRPRDAHALMAEMIEARHAAAGALQLPTDSSATPGPLEEDAPATLVAAPPVSAELSLDDLPEEDPDFEQRPTLATQAPEQAEVEAPVFEDPWSDTSSASLENLDMSQPFRTSVVYGADEPSGVSVPVAALDGPKRRVPAETAVLPARNPQTRPERRRRWPLAAVVFALTLAAVGHALGWF